MASQAIEFFFLWYGHEYEYAAQATCSFFDLLPPLFSRSKASSPLVAATTGLALLVTTLHARQNAGSDAALTAYLNAVAGTRKAMLCPQESKSDELLLAVLLLEAYETLSGVFGGTGARPLVRPRTHVMGSIALLQHRGLINYRDELSWRLVVATRSRFLHHASQGAVHAPDIAALLNVWHGGPLDNLSNPAVSSETLALELTGLKTEIYKYIPSGTPLTGSLCQDAVLAQSSVKDLISKLDIIISQATTLAGRFEQWYTALPPTWNYVPLSASDNLLSVPTAGSGRPALPTVYYSLSICNTYNRHRRTEIELLLLIQNCIYARSELTGVHEDPPTWIAHRIQLLTDEICQSIPFMTTETLNGEVLHQGMFSNGSLGGTASVVNDYWGVPVNQAEHARHVAASGLYMAFRLLKALFSLISRNLSFHIVASTIQDNQLYWIQEQINELGDTLGLSTF